MSDDKRGAIRYARSMSAWWRGDQSSCPPVTASELQVAKDAHRAVTGDGWGGREPTMAEVAAAWDRAADLLEKGGAP